MKIRTKPRTMNYQFMYKYCVFAFLFMFLFYNLSVAQEPILYWDFNEVNNRTIPEQKSGIADTLEGNFKLAGSTENPICNPAITIKNWNGNKAEVLVNGKPAKDARIGINYELEGDNLVVFLFLEKSEPVSITILP